MRLFLIFSVLYLARLGLIDVGTIYHEIDASEILAIYPKNPKNRNFRSTKASGFNDCKQVHVSNIDLLTIVKSREISLKPKPDFSGSLGMGDLPKDEVMNPDQSRDIPLWDGVKITHSDDEWRSILDLERYRVMRKKATERAFSGQYLNHNRSGIYLCGACHLALFDSSSKYDAQNGWPSFYAPIIQKHVWIKKDLSLPFLRYEVLCRACDSHLGHVFREPNKKLRYTINSIALDFQPD